MTRIESWIMRHAVKRYRHRRALWYVGVPVVLSAVYLAGAPTLAFVLLAALYAYEA